MPVLAENRKAHFNYTILETFQAGIVLNGQEVKSVRRGQMNLAGAYVVFHGEELSLIGAKIPPYQPKNAPADYDAERSRKLLLHKKELKYLLGKIKEGGLTLIPLRVYTAKRKVKLDFALARGKRQYDKRQKIRKQEAEREMGRALKRG